MAKYEVKFNGADAQAAVFQKAESDLRNYMSAVRTAALNLNTRENSLLGRPQADILVQLKKLERVCEKLTAEGNALPQIMEVYGKAERNTFAYVGENALVKGALSFIAGFWGIVAGWQGAIVNWVKDLISKYTGKPDNTPPTSDRNSETRVIPDGGATTNTMPAPPSVTGGYAYTHNGAAFRCAAAFEQYMYDQNDSKWVERFGKNLGCTATAEAMAVSIYNNTRFEPSQAGWVSGVGASWANSQKWSAKDYTNEQLYSFINDRISEGSPVVFRVNRLDGNDYGHELLAVGIRDGANPNALTAADILVIDPIDAKVKLLSEQSRKPDTSWSMFTPKKL